ncbi:hypothetical protein L596_006958 [Steinernema carpocapsae]|uniref:Uncharacterized protein n=1 Tax=Steinernema carpocapsae TaxID=34508 RepID=A0A4U5P8G7_STECR|nr:hypothetical protein L596_006958 [Steinernema carpocapsae]
MNFAFLGSLADRFFVKTPRSSGSGSTRERRSHLEELLVDGRRWSRTTCPQISIFFTLVLFAIDLTSKFWIFLQTFEFTLRAKQEIFVANDSTDDLLVLLTAEERSLSENVKNGEAGLLDLLMEGFKKIEPKTVDLVGIEEKLSRTTSTIHVTAVVCREAKLRSILSISHPISECSSIAYQHDKFKVVKSGDLPNGVLSNSLTQVKTRNTLSMCQNWLWEKIDRFGNRTRAEVFIENNSKEAIIVTCGVEVEKGESPEIKTDLPLLWTKIGANSRILFQPRCPLSPENLVLSIEAYSIDEKRVHGVQKPLHIARVSFPNDFSSGTKVTDEEDRKLEENRLKLFYE